MHIFCDDQSRSLGDRLLTVMAVAFNGMETSMPKPLFKIHATSGGALYDVAPKGDRFLVALPIEEAALRP